MRNAVKVLIVDDDKASSTLLGEVVKRMGMKPVIVNKPVDALNVVKLQSVNAALVDVLLPKMSGVDLVQEFRKTKFADAPVVLVSGVFKDKGFAQEAIKKTAAVDFLFKPFGADDLMNSLKNALANLLSSEKWTVQTLLTRKLNSARERAKAIENLDQIKGLDFPFVLSVLMDAGASGHINIVNDSGEIFGVSLVQGTVAEVDSTESQSTGVLALISKGFLAQEDWDEFQANGSKKFPLERLVQEGLVSPHAVAVAKHEQILYDFKAICSAQSLQINLVPGDEAGDVPKHAVKMDELLVLLESSLEELFREDYLREFYAALMSAPVQLVKDATELDRILSVPVFADLGDLKDLLREGATLADLLTSFPGREVKAFQCLHYLVLSRIIGLDDVNRTKSLSAQFERFVKLYEELKDRTPDKVFEYFGAPERAAPAVVTKIYDEYVKSNHPDQLPKEAAPELVDLCRKCFDVMINAKDIMTDETKRAELLEQLKEASVQNRRKSNELTAQGLELLKKGQFQQAVDTLKEAEKFFPTTRQYLILIWAQIKAGLLNNNAKMTEIAKHLEKNISPDDRKSPFYYMALGLVKKELGDHTAVTYFDKAIETDSTFAEARRERAALMGGGKESKNKKVDLFTGDITEVVSQLFRRKAD